MNYKRPNFIKRQASCPAIVQPEPPKNPLQVGALPKKGMSVNARYGEWTVFLLLTEDMNNNEYKATVEFFEPVALGSPKDLSKGDSVFIKEDCIWGFTAD